MTTVLQEQVENGNIVKENNLSQQDKDELKVGDFLRICFSIQCIMVLGSTWVRSSFIPKCANTKSCGKDQA